MPTLTPLFNDDGEPLYNSREGAFKYVDPKTGILYWIPDWCMAACVDMRIEGFMEEGYTEKQARKLAPIESLYEWSTDEYNGAIRRAQEPPMKNPPPMQYSPIPAKNNPFAVQRTRTGRGYWGHHEEHVRNAKRSIRKGKRQKAARRGRKY